MKAHLRASDVGMGDDRSAQGMPRKKSQPDEMPPDMDKAGPMAMMKRMMTMMGEMMGMMKNKAG